jgi:hypothetical protein
MRIVGVDDEGEDESATLVHSYENHAMVSNEVDIRLLASGRHMGMR